jgi:hypothetical protein
MIDRLRDILYFDLEKSASLISQIEGGLAQSRVEGAETNSDSRNVRKYDLLKMFNAEFGGIDSVKRTLLETKVLHHDLLMRLEDVLFSAGFATDINELGSGSSVEEARARFSQTAYLRARGWAAIEDFDRIVEMTRHFNELHGFVRRSAMEQKLGKAALRETQKRLDLAGKGETKEFKEGQAKLRLMEQQIKKDMEWEKLSEELFGGIRLWLDTMAHHRLQLRVVPFDTYPDLQLIANLKRDCFVDENVEQLLYGYGAQPNIKLTVFGLVTSLPPKDKTSLFNIYSGETA